MSEKRRNRLTFGLPKAGLLVRDYVTQQRFDEALHHSKEGRVIAVVGINVVKRQQDRAEGALATFGHNDFAYARELSCNGGNCCKLEAS